MSYASSALKAAVEASEHDQLYWAASLQMDPSQFNKYCNGKAPIGAAVLKKLLLGMPERYHAAIVRGYALDSIPDPYRGLVAIYAKTSTVQEGSADFLEGLPMRAQDVLRFLASQMHHRPVFDLLEDLERILKGQQQQVSYRSPVDEVQAAEDHRRESDDGGAQRSASTDRSGRGAKVPKPE